jgi:hypothetical protein
MKKGDEVRIVGLSAGGRNTDIGKIVIITEDLDSDGVFHVDNGGFYPPESLCFIKASDSISKMSQKEFDEFMEFIIEKHVKNVMCNKSAEYAQGGDKLHNFRRAARMHDTTPIEALRGMKLKHDCSIEDMLDGLREGKTYSQELWQEKLHDQINYTFLMWALLYKENGWELK